MLSTFLLRIMSFLSIENFKGSVLCLGGINSGLKNLRKEEQGGHVTKKSLIYALIHTLHNVTEMLRCLLCKWASYFRRDATVCVLSTMTGFDGGTNFGDSLSFPATRRHGDVDRNPEIEKKLRPSCFSSVSCKHKGYACYFFGEVVSSVSSVSSEWTQVRRVQRHVRKIHSYMIIQKI